MSDDSPVLPSGAELFLIGDFVGMSFGGDLETSTGYDGDVELKNCTPLTNDLRVELADHMVRRWQAYREQAIANMSAERRPT